MLISINVINFYLLLLQPSIHTSVSCADFDGSSVSSSYYNQRAQKSNSEPPGTIDRTDEKKRRKRREKSREDTRTSSGYNSYSELSEFGNTSKYSDDRQGKNKARDSSSDNERNERYSKYPRKTSKVTEDNKIHDVSHKRSDSKLSVAESDLSGSSKDKKRTTDKGSAANVEQKTHKVPAIGNVSVTVTNNIQYDPNDPFSFIQPIDLPFHKKVRKCLGPVMAVLLLIILAAALGAAIYFASALKGMIFLFLLDRVMKVLNFDIQYECDNVLNNKIVFLFNYNFCLNTY